MLYAPPPMVMGSMWGPRGFAASGLAMVQRAGAPQTYRPAGILWTTWQNMDAVERDEWQRNNPNSRPPEPPGTTPTTGTGTGTGTTGGTRATNLPGGLTAAEWNAMSPANQDRYIRENATTERERQELIARGISAGITTIGDVVRRQQEAEIARLEAQGTREAAREANNLALERDRIRAETDRLRIERGLPPAGEPLPSLNTANIGLQSDQTAANNTAAQTAASNRNLLLGGLAVAAAGVVLAIVLSKRKNPSDPAPNPYGNPHGYGPADGTRRATSSGSGTQSATRRAPRTAVIIIEDAPRQLAATSGGGGRARGSAIRVRDDSGRFV